MINRLVLALLSATILFGCQRTDLQPNQQEQPTSSVPKEITYRGLKAILPAGVPEAALDLTLEEFTEFFYQNYFRRAGLRTAGTWSGVGISDDNLIAIIQQESVKYPQLNVTIDISDSTFTRIKHDFPELKTKQQAFEHAEAIVLFYNDLLRHDVCQRVSKTAGGKTMYELNPKEEQVKMSDPMGALYWNAAKSDAELFVVHHFGEDKDAIVGNAYKHSVWNASGLHRFLTAGRARINAMNQVREFASAHEYAQTGTYMVRNAFSAMDLHNNLVGRTWFIGRTGFGLFGIRKMPSMTDVRDGIHAHVIATAQLKTEFGIVSMYDANENLAWSNLEMWGETPHHASVYIN